MFAGFRNNTTVLHTSEDACVLTPKTYLSKGAFEKYSHTPPRVILPAQHGVEGQGEEFPQTLRGSTNKLH